MQQWTILSLVAVQDELEKLIDAIKTHLPQDAAAEWDDPMVRNLVTLQSGRRQKLESFMRASCG
jgi:hypothetical protein